MNVFYAWQSDRPNSTNRGFIHGCLDRAVAKLGSDAAIVEDPRLDHDTLDVPGAPDIEHTIFRKIAQAGVFVCDVTLVTTDTAGRPSPNPNVLVELGYALHALGDARVLLIMNTVYGRPELLPFDIRRKRIITYELEPGGDKAPVRQNLEPRLINALRMSVEASRPKANPVQNPAAVLVEAIASGSPARRGVARAYAASMLERIDAGRPAHPESDDELVAALEASPGIVRDFAEVARRVAAYEQEDVVEEIWRLLEGVVNRYGRAPGANGTTRPNDFDFAKFIGHELLVVLVAAFLREEKWAGLSALLDQPFLVVRPEGTMTRSFGRLSQACDMLDRVRRARIGSHLISIRAEMLKARYESGELASVLPWEEFLQADLFLYLRGELQTARRPNVIGLQWQPWSATYLYEVPPMILRATSRRYAERLATGLGVELTPEFGEELRKSVFALANEYRRSGFDKVGEYFAWNEIGTK